MIFLNLWFLIIVFRFNIFIFFLLFHFFDVFLVNYIFHHLQFTDFLIWRCDFAIFYFFILNNKDIRVINFLRRLFNIVDLKSFILILIKYTIILIYNKTSTFVLTVQPFALFFIINQLRFLFSQRIVLEILFFQTRNRFWLNYLSLNIILSLSFNKIFFNLNLMRLLLLQMIIVSAIWCFHSLLITSF